MTTDRQEAIERVAELVLVIPVSVGWRTRTLRVPIARAAAERIVDALWPIGGEG